MYGSSMPCSLKAAHTLLCSSASKAFLKSMAATHSGWCHSVALSELLEREKVVCRGVAWSGTCLVRGFVVVRCGSSSLEEELAEEFVQGVIEQMGR